MSAEHLRLVNPLPSRSTPHEAGAMKTVPPGQVAVEAARILEAQLASLVPKIPALLDKQAVAGPSDVILSFGTRFIAEAGLVIAKTADELNLAVYSAVEGPHYRCLSA